MDDEPVEQPVPLAALNALMPRPPHGNGGHTPPGWAFQTPPGIEARPEVDASSQPTGIGDAPPPPPPPSDDAVGEAWSEERMLRRTALPPASRGMRRLLYRATAGRVNLGPNVAELRRREQLSRMNVRFGRTRVVAAAAGKGGVGKTTVSLLLGSAYAIARGDRVLALDCNQHLGTLALRTRRESPATITDLVRDAERIRDRYSAVREYTSQHTSRLEVLASPSDPAARQALAADAYQTAIDVATHHYSLILADLGTGLLDPGTQYMLRRADQVVVCCKPSLDEGRLADFTLDFLAHRDERKARAAVVVVSQVRRDGQVDIDALCRHFRGRCRSVQLIPYDRYLASGGELEWERLAPATREAVLEVAAVVADGFTRGQMDAFAPSTQVSEDW